MKIELQRLDDNFLFESSNDEGLTVLADGSPAIGGQGKGMRPMQLLLAAVASCSSIDIVLLLRKQRQDLKDIKVSVEGDRREEEPRIFTHLRVHYRLFGTVDAKKAERACRLSMEKLCSVSMMLKAGGVEVDWSYEILAV